MHAVRDDAACLQLHARRVIGADCMVLCYRSADLTVWSSCRLGCLTLPLARTLGRSWVSIVGVKQGRGTEYLRVRTLISRSMGVHWGSAHEIAVPRSCDGFALLQRSSPYYERDGLVADNGGIISCQRL